MTEEFSEETVEITEIRDDERRMESTGSLREYSRRPVSVKRRKSGSKDGKSGLERVVS